MIKLIISKFSQEGSLETRHACPKTGRVIANRSLIDPTPKVGFITK